MSKEVYGTALLKLSESGEQLRHTHQDAYTL